MHSTLTGSVLLVSPRLHHRSALHGIFGDAGWRVTESQSIAEACTSLASAWDSLVICDYVQPDGTWRDLMQSVRVFSPFSELIVTSHIADERMWAEIQNLGAFDLLAEPFDAIEALRVARSAMREADEKAVRSGCRPVRSLDSPASLTLS